MQGAMYPKAATTEAVTKFTQSWNNIMVDTVSFRMGNFARCTLRSLTWH